MRDAMVSSPFLMRRSETAEELAARTLIATVSGRGPWRRGTMITKLRPVLNGLAPEIRAVRPDTLTKRDDSDMKGGIPLTREFVQGRTSLVLDVFARRPREKVLAPTSKPPSFHFTVGLRTY